MNDNEWLLSHDPAQMVAQMRAILADPRKTQQQKLDALTLLAHIADEEAMEVLRWYRLNADPGMEFYAELALAEAEMLSADPQLDEGYDEALIDRILQCAEDVHAQIGGNALREEYRTMLITALRRDNLRVNGPARALVKYNGQLVEMSLLDMLVEGYLLVGIWGADCEAERIDDAILGEVYTPVDDFYADLRASNLDMGLLIDLTGDLVTWDILTNRDKNRGLPEVEYILSLL